MEQILTYLVSTAVTLLMVAIVVLMKKGHDVLREKANGFYDQNRNSKVDELLALVGNNIDDSIKAFFTEYDLTDITEADIQPLLSEVQAKVTTLTGSGVIDYLLSVFVDNWEEWIREKILARVSELKSV